MHRRAFLTLAPLALAATSGRAGAAGYADDVAAQLTKQGFRKISTTTTWLGRVRITAERKDGRREIVLNPRTGEILRDQWTLLRDPAAAKPIIDDVGEGSDDDGSDDSGSDDGGSDDSGSDDHGSGGGGSDDGGSDDGGSDGGDSGGDGKGDDD